MNEISTVLLQGLQIVWINILLSGDNAVVIALAARRLQPAQRRRAVFWGAFAAVALRIVFTGFVVALQQLPYVKMASAILLLWIAFQLLGEDEDAQVAEATSVWSAVRTIAVADAVMSLDNAVAVAAAARNSVPLIVFGIAVSVPLIVFGSTVVLKLLSRFPVLAIAGAALLGWVAGEIFVADPKLAAWVGPLPDWLELAASAAGAAFVLLLAAVRLATRARRSQPSG